MSDALDLPDWMEEARQIAAQCWCGSETSGIEMDATLCEAVAKRIASWMCIAAQNERNTEYYRGLVIRCGEAIGPEAYKQDDGGICEDVLCAKVPELVERLCEDVGAGKRCVGQLSEPSQEKESFHA